MKITCHLCGKVQTVALGEVPNRSFYFCSTQHYLHWIKLTKYKGLVSILHGDKVITTNSN